MKVVQKIQKLLCFIVIIECITKISGYVLYFEGPGRRYFE